MRTASFHPALFESDPSLYAVDFFTLLAVESAICNLAANLMSLGPLMRALAFSNGGLGDQTSSHQLDTVAGSRSYATQITPTQSNAIPGKRRWVAWKSMLGNGKGGDTQAGLEDDGSQKGIVTETEFYVERELADPTGGDTPHEQEQTYDWRVFPQRSR